MSVGLGIRWNTDPKEQERGLALVILGSISTFPRPSNLNHETSNTPRFDPLTTTPQLHLPTVFIPGSYASTQLLGAYLGWPGYDYSYVPSYDD